MKAPVLIFSLLLISVSAFDHILAQSRQSKIDSLQTLLKTAPYDSNRVKIYADLSWHYASTREKTDSASIFADSVRILSEDLEFERGKSLSHFYYGVIGRHEGNYDEALEHLNTFVNDSRDKDDTGREAAGLFQIGVIQYNLGNYEESLTAYQRVLEIHEENNYWYGVGFTLNGMGIIYKNMKKYGEAIKQYQRSLAIFDSLQIKEDQAFVLGNLGNLYAEQEDYQNAFSHYQRSLEISREIDITHNIASSLENIGNVLTKQEKYNQALSYQLEALNLRKNLPEQKMITISLNKVGYTYLNLGEYQPAEDYLSESLNMAKKIGAKPEMRDSYEYLAELHAQEENFEQALVFHRLYSTTKDSILDTETVQQINELQAKYETAKKNEEIAILSRENELRVAEAERRATWNRVLIGGLILFAVIAGLIVFMLRQRHKNEKLVAAKNEEIKTARFKQQLSELEMKALRAQMNPHFIFNCMNSINHMILSEDGVEASRYLTKFSKLIRLLLENSDQPTVSLEDELAMLETYIQLEALRFKDKITYRIAVDEKIDQENTLVPSMVLQPFVENAIWHGLMHKEDNGLINISISENNNMLWCVIEDNGVGREKALELQENTAIKHQSMGLQITEERLQLLNSKELRELVRITDLKDSVNQALGTRVDISIPIA